MLVTLPNCSVLSVYGWPDGDTSSVLSGWLEENEERYIIIFEEKEEILLKQGFHDRVRLCSVNHEEAMKALAWEFVFLDFDYFLYPETSSAENQTAKEAFAKMAHFCEGIHLVASSYRERGLDGLKNILKNWPILAKARQGMDLFGKFPGIPAIICGAGLSLEKELGELKELENKALLFAGGTTLCSLAKFGITPHFAAAIDPHPLPRRFEKHIERRVPMFFQGRTQCSLLQQMRGEFLWIPSNCGDPGEEWLCEQLKSTHFQLETGWNVSTFLAVIAQNLGCNPIIFVGMDFVEENGQSYAGGIEREEKGPLIPVPGREGIWTRRDWVQAAGWLSSWIKEHPQQNWINTSFQGLEILGAEKKALKDLSFPVSRDLRSLIQPHLQSSSKLVKDSQEFLSQKNAFLHSFSKVRTHCEKILKLLEKIFPQLPSESGEYAILEMEIEKEIAYQTFLLPVWEIWRHVFARKVPKNIPEAYALGLNRWLFIKGICDETRSL